MHGSSWWRRMRRASGRGVAMVSRARRLTCRLMGFSFLPRRWGSPSPGPAAGAGRRLPLEVSPPSPPSACPPPLQAQCQLCWRAPASRRRPRAGHQTPPRARAPPRSPDPDPDPDPVPDTQCEFVRLLLATPPQHSTQRRCPIFFTPPGPNPEQGCVPPEAEPQVASGRVACPPAARPSGGTGRHERHDPQQPGSPLPFPRPVMRLLRRSPHADGARRCRPGAPSPRRSRTAPQHATQARFCRGTQARGTVGSTPIPSSTRHESHVRQRIMMHRRSHRSQKCVIRSATHAANGIAANQSTQIGRYGKKWATDSL